MGNSTGITDLETLITKMEPALNEGEYVFVSVLNKDDVPREMAICEIKEKEGITFVLLKKDADFLDLTYEFIASWITLNVHSSLEAVGLTAAFSTELGKNNISCNVIAGYYHDHIFVNKNEESLALMCLKNMTKR